MKTKSSIYIGLFALITALCCSTVSAQDGEWFAHNGYTAEEVVSGPAGQVIVMKDSSGSYFILSPQEQTDSRFQVVAIGSQQVRLRAVNEKDPFMMPVMHSNLPLDILTYATLMVQNKSVFISAPVSQVYARYEGTDNYREELTELLDFNKSGLIVYSDLAMAGSGTPDNFPALFNGSSSSSVTVNLSEVRVPLSALVEKLSTVTGKKYVITGNESFIVSIHTKDMSPESVLYYLSGLTGTEITINTPSAQTNTADSNNGKQFILPDKEKRVLVRVRKLAKAGRYKDSARLMLKLVKRTAPKAQYYNMLSKLCWKAGAKRMSVKCLKKSLKIDPQNMYARSRLQKLRRAHAGHTDSKKS